MFIFYHCYYNNCCFFAMRLTKTMSLIRSLPVPQNSVQHEYCVVVIAFSADRKCSTSPICVPNNKTIILYLNNDDVGHQYVDKKFAFEIIFYFSELCIRSFLLTCRLATVHTIIIINAFLFSLRSKTSTDNMLQQLFIWNLTCMS